MEKKYFVLKIKFTTSFIQKNPSFCCCCCEYWLLTIQCVVSFYLIKRKDFIVFPENIFLNYSLFILPRHTIYLEFGILINIPNLN